MAALGVEKNRTYSSYMTYTPRDCLAREPCAISLHSREALTHLVRDTDFTDS
jgi:hypothetical protein